MSANLPALRTESESAIATMVDQLGMIDRAIKAVMVKGVDYGVIPGAKTPTLLKPGAEKLLALFKLAATIPEERIVRFEDWDRAIFSYEVVCQIVRADTGEVVAEGIGSANSKEPKWKRNGDQQFGMVNTILKMAKKRALLDATLTATASSGRFTQDIDDEDVTPAGYQEPRAAPPVAHGLKMKEAMKHKYESLAKRAHGLGLHTIPWEDAWTYDEAVEMGKILRVTVENVEAEQGHKELDEAGL